MSLYPSSSAFTLKATISEPYKQLRVFMYIRGGQITFWDETHCQDYPSVLMSHTRSVEGVCNPFCGVPTYCNLVRRVGSSIYKFLCVCPHGPLARYTKLRVRMRRECRERFPRHRR